MAKKKRLLIRSLAVAVAGFCPAACTAIDNVAADMRFRGGDVSLTERCVYFMKQAFPNISIADLRTQSSTDIDSTTARIDGVNESGSSTGMLVRDIGAECRFVNGVLTQFHWTAGPFR